MTWKVEGDIVGDGDRSDPGNTVTPAVRTTIQQRINALTHIGTRQLTWIKQGVINAAARSLEYEATFEGDITAAEFRSFAIAIYGQSPVIGRLFVQEKETEMPWFQVKVLSSNWRAKEFTKPPTSNTMSGSRSSW
jgi:hypothetical protein